MLIGIGLSISTLHSHHHYHWNHSPDSPHAHQCLTVDTTVCPVAGYIFETDVLSKALTGSIYFFVLGSVEIENVQVSSSSVSTSRERSPPALV